MISAEFSRPRPTKGGFADSRAIFEALAELTDISRMRGRAHADANLFRDLHVDALDSGSHTLRQRLSSTRTVLARWALMSAHQEFRTVDLARIESCGDWDAAAAEDGAINELGMRLFMAGETNGLVERGSPEAKLGITVDPTLVAGQGLLAVRRKRLMIATLPANVGFVSVRPVLYRGGQRLPEPQPLIATADVHTEVDKVTEFVLNVDQLRDIDPLAVIEVQGIAELGIPMEVSSRRMARAASAIEVAVNERHSSLAPAVVTYYADRKYRNIQDVASADVMADV